MNRPPGDGNAVLGRYYPGMELQRPAPEHGTGGVIAAAGLGLLAVGGWVVSDSLMGRAVRLRYAAQSPPPIVETTLTVWGWCALIIAAIGALCLAASTTWVLVMWRGFATGWTERAVPVVPAWLARAAAAGVAAGLALAAVAVCGTGTYRKGWVALRHGALNINALMSLAVTGALPAGMGARAGLRARAAAGGARPLGAGVEAGSRPGAGRPRCLAGA